MDNVIENTVYPLPAQEQEARNKRRIGIGVFGAANAIELILGKQCYGEPEYLDFQDKILSLLCNTLYQESVKIAKEKESFELFDADHHVKGSLC